MGLQLRAGRVRFERCHEIAVAKLAVAVEIVGCDPIRYTLECEVADQGIEQDLGIVVPKGPAQSLRFPAAPRWDNQFWCCRQANNTLNNLDRKVINGVV